MKIEVTKVEKKQYLETFFNRYEEIKNILTELDNILGVSTESSLSTKLFELTDDYAKAVSTLTGVSLDDIFWYMFECELGEKPMMAAPGSEAPGEYPILVDSVDALLEVSEWGK